MVTSINFCRIRIVIDTRKFEKDVNHDTVLIHTPSPILRLRSRRVVVLSLTCIILASWHTLDGFGRSFGSSRMPSGALGIVRAGPREGKRRRSARQREVLLCAVGAGHGTGDPEGQDDGYFHAGDYGDDTAGNSQKPSQLLST